MSKPTYMNKPVQTKVTNVVTVDGVRKCLINSKDPAVMPPITYEGSILK